MICKESDNHDSPGRSVPGNDGTDVVDVAQARWWCALYSAQDCLEVAAYWVRADNDMENNGWGGVCHSRLVRKEVGNEAMSGLNGRGEVKV